MKTLALLLFAVVGFAISTLAAPPVNGPLGPVAPPANPPANTPKKMGMDMPEKWAYYKDEAKTQRLGELTFDPAGSFKLVSWNGKDVTKGKWKVNSSGAVQMTWAQAGFSEAPGIIYIKDDSAVWKRAIGDRYLAVVKAPE